MKENVALPNPPVRVFNPELGKVDNLPSTLNGYELKEGTQIADAKTFHYSPDSELSRAQWPQVHEGSEVNGRLTELEETLEKLREESRIKANFINAVVHDIRSPLTVVLGVVDLMNEDLKAEQPFDKDYYQQLLGDALRSCQEVSDLINDILELSKMSQQKLLALNFESVLVGEIVESTMEVAGGIARQAGIKLECKLQANLPRLFLDRKQMHRALMNLVSNAIKFTSKGGTVTIRASFLNEKRRDALYDYVLLSVIDTGEGLAPDESPYIFDAYWQAQNGKRKTGTGLGLTIVKRIAVAHGGNVSVRSQRGKGSSFTIMIPVLEEAPQQPTSLAEKL